MSLEPPLLSSEHFSYHHKSSTFNSLNKTGSDCDVDDKASLGDKYLFPYTGKFWISKYTRHYIINKSTLSLNIWILINNKVVINSIIYY